MAIDTKMYLVSEDIALRSGLINSRYRVKGNKFVLNNKDLSLIRLTSDEFINGLQGVELISEQEANTLISENGFKLGQEHLQDEQESKSEQNDNNANEEE